MATKTVPIWEHVRGGELVHAHNRGNASKATARPQAYVQIYFDLDDFLLTAYDRDIMALSEAIDALPEGDAKRDAELAYEVDQYEILQRGYHVEDVPGEDRDKTWDRAVEAAYREIKPLLARLGYSRRFHHLEGI